MRRHVIASVVYVMMAGATLPVWAGESCFNKGDNNLQFGIYPGGAYSWIGMVGTYEHAVHDMVSVGGSVGLSYYRSFDVFYDDYYHSYVEIPFGVRGMFHPFNLPVLMDKIPVRDKIDVYGGIITGWAPGIWRSHYPSGATITSASRPDRNFIISGVIGARYYLNPNFGFYVEETANSFGWFNGGVVLKF